MSGIGITPPASAAAVDAIKALTDGAMVAMPITYPLPAFNRSTFAANGATIYVTADGPVTLSNKALLVQRVHRGR